MSNELEQLEAQLKDSKLLIERRDMALKLAGNREFKKLILDDYMVTEAARLIGASADPNLTDPKMQGQMVAMAQAAGHLKRYLSVIVTMGNNAEKESRELEEVIAEVRAEPESDEVNETNGGLA